MSHDKKFTTLTESILKAAVIENHNREMEVMPTEKECSLLIKYSYEHEEKMKRLFIQENRNEILKKVINISKKIAVVFLITLSILISFLLTKPQVRAAVWETILEWYDTFTRIQYSGDPVTDSFIQWRPTYIPKGYQENEVTTFANTTLIIYTNRVGESITLEYSLSNGSSMAIDNEHSNYRLEIIEDIKLHIFEATSSDFPSNITCEKSGYCFVITSFIVVDELLDILISIEPLKK